MLEVGDVSTTDMKAYELLFEKDKAIVQFDIFVWKETIHVIGVRIE